MSCAILQLRRRLILAAFVFLRSYVLHYTNGYSRVCPCALLSDVIVADKLRAISTPYTASQLRHTRVTSYKTHSLFIINCLSIDLFVCYKCIQVGVFLFIDLSCNRPVDGAIDVTVLYKFLTFKNYNWNICRIIYLLNTLMYYYSCSPQVVKVLARQLIQRFKKCSFFKNENYTKQNVINSNILKDVLQNIFVLNMYVHSMIITAADLVKDY